MTKTNSYSRTASRGDGLETRAKIIDCAGRLIAQHGFEATTSKLICTTAQVNMAAVNYHFGSRDGLYLAVLKEAHTYLMNLDLLTELENSTEAAETKISQLIDLYINSILRDNSWYVEVWARELLQPSSFFQEVFQGEVVPKLNSVLRLFASYLGITTTDKRLYSCLFTTMSPFVMLYWGHRNPIQLQLTQGLSYEDFLKSLKALALANLANYRHQLQKKAGF
ncbi:MAG: TetR/AcrR family transcriptional regulator [Phascolarctobacterium sp.]